MRLQSTSLSAHDRIVHGFFTRDGGVSGGIYGTLNCGPGSKDRPEDVAENRRRVAEELGLGAERLVSPYQYHSAEVFVAESTWTREDAPKADALVTREPGLAIGVSTADCVPVLFADADAGVVGAAHAGWRGALSGVLEATLEAMEKLGADRGAIRAAVGPAISQTAYEVGEEFRDNFLQADAANARFFAVPSSGAKPHFDLPGYAAMRLRGAGVAVVDELGVCTYAEENRLFSYRRSYHKSEDDYGRQISAIVIPR